MMKKETFEVEADTLESAKKEAISKRPEGAVLFSEEVVHDGAPKTVKGVANTIEDAYAAAQKQVPTDAEITTQKVIIDPTRKVFDVEGFSELEAKAQAGRKIDATAILESLTLKTVGKKGFLSLGKIPNIYEAQVFQKAVVEVAHKKKAKIRVTTITDLPSKGYCQRCGKTNSHLKLLEKSAHFFCSPNCEEKYSAGKLYSTLLGGRRIFAGPGVDTFALMGMQQEAEASEEYCWSCGSRMSMLRGSKCQNCGNQEIEV